MINLSDLLSMYENEYAYTELLKQLKNTIPFVGAGVTCSYYPLWKQYLKSECKKYNITNMAELFKMNSYEDIAEIILERIGETAFFADIKTTFSSEKFKPYSSIGPISLLPNIFQDTVITTNFDCALELAYKQAKCDFQKVLFPCYEEQVSKTMAGNRHNLIKLHGDISENSFLVFTKKQYSQAYGDPIDLNKPFLQMLQKCIIGKTLLFIGCSLNTDRITLIMEKIIKNNPNITHFAFLEEPPKKKYSERTIALSKMGILPIYFPSKQFECIDILLEDILKKNFT